MKRREAQRESSARIRYMNGSARKIGGLNKVEAPDEHGNWIELTDKTLMEKALLEEYERCVTQANDTPCMQSPMVEVLQNLVPTTVADEVMQGTFTPPDGTPKEIQEVFKYLAMKEGMKNVHVPSPMTLEECQYGWKGVKERTSSSSK